MDKKNFNFFSTEISHNEIKKIKEKLAKSKIGADQLENLNPSYISEEILKSINENVELKEFNKKAKLDSGGNQLKLINDLEQQLEDFKIYKIQTKLSLERAQDKGDADLIIEYMLKYQNAKNFISSWEKKIDKIKNNN